MLGKHKTVVLLAMFLLFAGAVLSAPSHQINKLGLTHENGFTILTISGNSSFQTAHQSVEAKEGKPFRVVIDCLGARHGLPHKEYSNLPKSVITSIRTSQYAVTPEEVVRVVVDLTGEAVYRIETVENAVKVYISDPNTQGFSQWTTAVAKAKKETVSKGKKDAKLASATPAKPAGSPNASVEKTSTKKPSNVAAREKKEVVADVATPAADPVPSKPVPSNVVDKAATKETKKKADPVVASTQMKDSTVNATAPKKDLPQPVADTPKAPKTKITVDLAKNNTDRTKMFAALDGGNQKNVSAASNSADQLTKEAPAVVAKAPDTTVPKPEEKEAEAENPADHEPAIAQSPADLSSEELASTDNAPVAVDKPSRFRQTMPKSNNLKQTEVVQFPERLVIQYSSNVTRDPFETLLKESTKGRKSVDLNRIPSVEGLNLVGILELEVGPGAALMQDLDGIGYILKPGDRVQNGYVAQVDEQAVYFEINEYGWTRTIVKKMEKEK